MLERNGVVFTDPTHVQFIEEMELAGYEIQFYRGRFFYYGPGAVVDSMQEAARATRVNLGSDNMGRQIIVHPRVSDPTLAERT